MRLAGGLIVLSLSLAVSNPIGGSESPKAAFTQRSVESSGQKSGQLRIDSPAKGAVVDSPPTDQAVNSYAPVCPDGTAETHRKLCEKLDEKCSARPGGRLGYFYRAAPELPQGVVRLEQTCLYPGETPERPGGGLVVAVTERELRQLPIAAAGLGSQPGRHTLKGAETNVYAESAEQVFDTTVLGRRVEVRVRPVEHRFDYGDGTSLVSAAPGGPVPEARWGEKTVTSHVFAGTGDFAVGLSTVFAGEFSVGGGPWQAIAGTAVVPSAPRTLSVWRSEVRLYAENCLQNPHGQGC